MNNLEHIIETEKWTVASEREFHFPPITDYQSEAALEDALIEQLIHQGYGRVQIHTEAELIANLRKQIEKLNDYHFSDADWQKFFTQEIANKSHSAVQKTRTIQEDHAKSFIDENGVMKNIYLLDKRNIYNNTLQVLNQYEATGASWTGEKRDTRYDVTLLVNGLPLVHIELKRRGVHIKEAFNQIERYQRESFWADSGLFEYVQIFVISNGTTTKYYSNTTRAGHLKENEGRVGKKRTSNSFEFTSYWAYSSNKRIEELREFTATFLSKHTLLNILTKYCVFTEDKLLLVMRPYQIAATEKILERIQLSLSQRLQGSVRAGGYIWHTTGSGKTLTSFKTARLASGLSDVDKVLFVVDRQDLDYQTMREYDEFQKGAVDGAKNVRELEKNMRDPSKPILVTTIQKLAIFIARNEQHDIYNKNVVLIFDECHRSQFGDMHTAITKKFKKYLLFGFTGTPIFAANASTSSKNPDLKTTEQAFGDKLHTYTVMDAIRDENVLKFKVDTVNTLKVKADIQDEKIPAIDREKILQNPQRIANVVEYILQNFDAKTLRNDSGSYTLKDKRVKGFNAMFAVSSIPALRLYYSEFKKQMRELPSDKKLKIAAIYSFGQNDEVGDILEDEDFETARLNASDRDFLAEVIKDYNATFGTSFDTSSEKFQNYYKDLSQRIKNRELDLVIVVNMFLTGFDATTLNTLWVDKNLRMHGLTQAFSRTNRILNSVKAFGNIVCFRNLEKETDEAISLFGDAEAKGIVLLRAFEDYYFGFDDDDGKKQKGYAEIIEEIRENYPLPVSSQNYGEKEQANFVRLFGAVLKLKNILRTFDKFAEMQILSDGEFQDYQSFYLEIYERPKKEQQNPENRRDISEDLVFEMDLVRSVEINIDYILMLIEEMHAKNMQNKEILAKISSAISSSPSLRNKKDLIDNFVNGINAADETEGLKDKWHEFVAKNKERELAKIIAEEHLQDEKARKFIADAFANGEIKEVGTGIVRILPPAPIFEIPGQETRNQKKERVVERLKEFLERFLGI